MASPIYYNKADFISTVSGTKVSKKSVLCGDKIHNGGRSVIKRGVVLRGDLAMIRIGKFVVIGENTVIRPPIKKLKGEYRYFPMTVGDNIWIGENCIISAAQIGSNVSIGENCVIGKCCVIKDNCKILPGTVLAPDTVVTPFSVFAGSPGRLVAELPESGAQASKEATLSYYKRFLPRPKPTGD
eukprot:GHVN01087370.1.p1 GENE.GHVN01087370.1~~GHVN01087370.1.p1  ORF type:complete len:184 (-),score=21.23 GHVN01087370.1:99-650(-)